MRNSNQGITLKIHVIPRAKLNEITEILPDGSVKIRLAAPPVEGKANQILLKFLADLFDVPVARIEIIRGDKSRRKLIFIRDIDSNTVDMKIHENLSLRE